MQDLKDKISSLVGPFLVEQGFDLVDVYCPHRRGADAVQILADRPRGGITVDECADLSRQIDTILEKENIFSGSYTLEVSSPGIDRPLVSDKDFSRATGKEVVFYLKEPVQGRLEWQGIILRSDETNVIIQSRGVEVDISFQLINKAQHVF
ncbi:MAG TPA: ribosome maturation factor RimP [Candidatus Omnitrophota bacterium]|nr:ribosome maturation factor RimP [Candidatus Omnitrophota bacterium]HQL42007.1 ribosome maturation factor RimP [Candidatus Omnitrophota bacterium]